MDAKKRAAEPEATKKSVRAPPLQGGRRKPGRTQPRNVPEAFSARKLA